MGELRTIGPLGLDPFGACPYNRLDKKLERGKWDEENPIRNLVRSLETRAHAAEQALKKVSQRNKGLVEKLTAAKKKIAIHEKVADNIVEVLVKED